MLRKSDCSQKGTPQKNAALKKELLRKSNFEKSFPEKG